MFSQLQQAWNISNFDVNYKYVGMKKGFPICKEGPRYANIRDDNRSDAIFGPRSEYSVATILVRLDFWFRLELERDGDATWAVPGLVNLHIADG